MTLDEKIKNRETELQRVFDQLNDEKGDLIDWFLQNQKQWREKQNRLNEVENVIRKCRIKANEIGYSNTL